jgi:hypothetical protein
MDDLARRWHESAHRSRERRAAAQREVAPVRGRIARVGFAVAAAAALGVAVYLADPRGTEPDTAAGAATSDAELTAFSGFAFEPPAWEPERQVRERRPSPLPDAKAIRAASAYAASRAGLVSFAVIDSRGRMRGREPERLYSAASVVKAMVLSAELRRLAADDAEVDESTASLLKAMITASDNEAADAVYARVGDAGMHEVAERAGMTHFVINGHWGNAQVTAADMARFFGDLDRMLPERFREFGQSLFGSVIESQSWGIPVAAGDRWAARFKGGWLPDHALVHQAAELREVGGPREIAMAILTDEQPSHAYGVETVEGVAEHLLR